jgi:RES domain-containing protein
VTLWRISDYPELDGAGGLLASGRWHTQGSRIVYCAPNPAASLVEVLVHIEIDADDLADPLQYLEIDAPDMLAIEDADALGPAWRTDLAASRRAGDAWLRAGRSALFRVPSVLVPSTWNVLINPRHPDSRRIRIARVHTHAMDFRLLR